ncbi:MAG: peptide-methionine (S)-S-oxide reductase MsrA [Bacteroidota bacterium]
MSSLILNYNQHWIRIGSILLGILMTTSLFTVQSQSLNETVLAMTTPNDTQQLETATFGGGCFWCVEAVFERLDGVQSVTSGYAGGHVENPTYKQVTRGNTGHAEVIQLTYDPSKISFEKILEVHFKTHDPTTLNRQGADVGPQYRSIILYHNDEQKEIAQNVINKLNDAQIWDDPIVTKVEALDTFYEAEEYHQDYYENNRSQPYCQFVIGPKLKKLEKAFGELLKEKERS